MNRTAKQQWLWIMVAVIGMTGFWTASADAKVIADYADKSYHREDCPLVKQIKPRNLREIDSEPEADAKGYFPCEKCITPARQPSVKEIKKLSAPVDRERIYIGNPEDQTYHHAWCPAIKGLSEKNLIRFKNAKTASEKGFPACKECNPPVMFKRSVGVQTEETKPKTKEEEREAQPKPPTEQPQVPELDEVM